MEYVIVPGVEGHLSPHQQESLTIVWSHKSS